MFKFYSYEVFGELDRELVMYCKKNGIGCSDNGRTIVFAGEKEDLQKLHDEFFNEYEFNIEEVTMEQV